MTTPQVVETSVTVYNNSPIQDYIHLDDQTQPFENFWRQYVKIDSTKSSYENITCGKPQGLTLGPLLFLWKIYQTVFANFWCGALLMIPIYLSLART